MHRNSAHRDLSLIPDGGASCAYGPQPVDWATPAARLLLPIYFSPDSWCHDYGRDRFVTVTFRRLVREHAGSLACLDHPFGYADGCRVFTNAFRPPASF